METFSGQFSAISDHMSPKCWDLGWAFDYSIHGVVEILPMEPILLPATQTDKSTSGHPSKNVTNLSAVGTLNIYNSLGSGFLCSLLLCSSSVCFLFSCLCLGRLGGGGGGGACGKRSRVLRCGFHIFSIGFGQNPVDFLHVALPLVEETWREIDRHGSV